MVGKNNFIISTSTLTRDGGLINGVGELSQGYLLKYLFIQDLSMD